MRKMPSQLTELADPEYLANFPSVWRLATNPRAVWSKCWWWRNLVLVAFQRPEENA